MSGIGLASAPRTYRKRRRGCGFRGNARPSREVASASGSWQAERIYCTDAWRRFQTQPWPSCSSGCWSCTTSRSASGLCGTRWIGWGCDLKKTQHASEQERPDVREARDAWRVEQVSLDAAELIFLDETWISTNIARRSGRSLRGDRLQAAGPHGHWKTTTFPAGLSYDGVVAPLVLDGPIDGES